MLFGLPPDPFAARMVALERKIPQARLGVAVKDLRTGRTWLYRGQERFPLQSTFKLPLAWAVLREVDRGKLALDGTLLVKPSDLDIPTTVLEDLPKEGKAYPVRDLIEMASAVSDNIAADTLMARIGGPTALTRAIAKRGFRVDRYEYQLQRDSVGLTGHQDSIATEGAYLAALARVPAERQRAALLRYLSDPRDTSTPTAMLAFLEDFAKGKGLKPATQRVLMDIALGTNTGPGRLRAGLPKGATLAHKTGTGRTVQGRCSAVNDVGIVTLPNGRKLIVVAFLSGAKGTSAQREAILADVARAAVKQIQR